MSERIEDDFEKQSCWKEIKPSIPPPARDWKPVTDEKVLVEAKITQIGEGKYVWVDIDDEHVPVPLSSIHPMTGRDGNS